MYLFLYVYVCFCGDLDLGYVEFGSFMWYLEFFRERVKVKVRRVTLCSLLKNEVGTWGEERKNGRAKKYLEIKREIPIGFCSFPSVRPVSH